MFYPKEIKNDGAWIDQPAHLIDIMATIVDVTGVKFPEMFNGHYVLPLEGTSLKPNFTGESLPNRQIFEEHESNRALYEGDFKFVTKNFAYTDGSSPAHQMELYNLKTDPSELNNLASTMPLNLRQMVIDWNTKANAIGVPAERLLDVPSSISEKSADEDLFKIFRGENGSTLTIATKGISGNCFITLIDMFGRELTQYDFESGVVQLNIPQNVRGAIILRLENNGISCTKKVIL